MLMRGFTTVRDCAGLERPFAQAQEEGLITAPRMVVCGKAISQTGGHGDLRGGTQDEHCYGACASHRNPSIGRVADGVPNCLSAARDELRRGADFIKICGTSGGVASPTDPIVAVMYTDDEVSALAGTANRFGKYATSHAYTDDAVMHAIRGGCTCIEHGNLVSDETLSYMATHGITLVPTLITYAAFQRDRSNLPDRFNRKNDMVVDKGLHVLKRAHELGVHTCFGTDLLSGYCPLQSEEFNLRAAVLPADIILQQATCNSAKLAGQPGMLGTITREGAHADLIVLSADAPNPLESVEALYRGRERYFDSIIQAGRVVFERNATATA